MTQLWYMISNYTHNYNDMYITPDNVKVLAKYILAKKIATTQPKIKQRKNWHTDSIQCIHV